MPKHISMVLVCILALFLTSCISPNWLVFCEPGIIASTHLSSGRNRSAESLSREMSFHYLDIKFDEVDNHNSRLNSINLLFEDKSVNLGNVKYEEIVGINPVNKCCKKNVFGGEYLERASICFDYLQDGDVLVARIVFDFSKDKNVTEVYCYCKDAQGSGCILFENTAQNAMFQMPFKVDELKALFGGDAQIYKSFAW